MSKLSKLAKAQQLPDATESLEGRAQIWDHDLGCWVLLDEAAVAKRWPDKPSGAAELVSRTVYRTGYQNGSVSDPKSDPKRDPIRIPKRQGTR